MASVAPLTTKPAKPGLVWRQNPGRLPVGVEGKRVRVKLRHNGEEPTYDDNPMSPPGWAADGKGGCRWTLTGDPFDIIEYAVLR